MVYAGCSSVVVGPGVVDPLGASHGRRRSSRVLFLLPIFDEAILALVAAESFWPFLGRRWMMPCLFS